MSGYTELLINCFLHGEVTISCKVMQTMTTPVKMYTSTIDVSIRQHKMSIQFDYKMYYLQYIPLQMYILTDVGYNFQWKVII